MSPCHCHLIFLSPVVHHHHHHHHHFHYASPHLCSIPDSKLTFSINPSHHSLAHLFRRMSRIFISIFELNCSSIFCFVFLFSSVMFDSCDRLHRPRKHGSRGQLTSTFSSGVKDYLLTPHFKHVQSMFFL